MAAKRLFEDQYGCDSDIDDHHPTDDDEHTRSGPSLSPPPGDGDAVTRNFLRIFCSSLEPTLRKVVNEEVTNALQQYYTRSLTSSPASLQIQSQELPTLKLIFTKNPPLKIFTGTKILDLDNNPLQIIVVDTTRADHHQMIPTTTNYLPTPIKVEIVVLDGDFPKGDFNNWTSEEFDRNIVKERTGKRPLLAGDLHLTIRPEGFGSVGDIEFTDNSSWIRSRKFRLGARIVQGKSPGQVVKIKEAMTQPFVVKDHRGELYKKHHPPMLEDEVWRLEKIGKDGVFHKKLTSHGFHSVQDFLRLSVVDPIKLRRILGRGMSEKIWDVTLKHARTCVIGSKLYIFRGPNHNIVLNPICQVVKVVINGHTYNNQDLTAINRAYIENLVREAYSKWNSLEEIDGFVHQTPLLTQGELVDEYSNHHHTTETTYQKSSLHTDASMEAGSSIPNSDWGLNSSTYIQTPDENATRYNFSESSSDG